MKTRIILLSASIVATLALSGCTKTTSDNMSATSSATSDNAPDMNDVAGNASDYASNGGDTMHGEASHGDETHP